MIRYKVTLSLEERNKLQQVMAKGKHTSQQFRNACILLNCDEADGREKTSNEQVAQILQINVKTIERVRQRFVEKGFEACMERKAYPDDVREIKTDGDFEAHLVALSCSKAPAGRKRWSLRLLADTMVELSYVENISHESVRKVLKKTRSSPGKG